MKSCEGCPSFKTGADIALVYKDDPGISMCGRYMRPMEKPNSEPAAAERIRLTFAENCESYGEPFTLATTLPSGAFQVTTGDTTVQPSETDNAPRSCTGCAHFVPPRVVKDELGWQWGLCAASGRLLMPSRYRQEARSCLYGETGAPRDTTTGLYEMPVYQSGLSTIRVGSPSYDAARTVVEPQDYPTDAEVTEDDVASGIRAWRRLYDPNGSGKSIDLPIFDRDSFPAEEQELIPCTGDDEHPEWYIDHAGIVYKAAAVWMGIDQAPILWGDSGTGKTEAARYLAWLMGLPFERVNLRPDTEFEEIAGSPQFSVRPERRGDPEARPETWWKDGVLPRRWERPGLILLDEPNMAPSDVWAFLRPAIDNSKQLVVDDRRRARHPFTYLVLAANPAYNPAYAGTRELSQADMSRLRHMRVGLPPADLERQIIVRSCSSNEPSYEPPTETVDKVMAIAKEIRDMVADGSLPVSWAIRENSAVLRLTQFFGLVDAYKLAITDGLEPETGKQILDIVTNYGE